MAWLKTRNSVANNINEIAQSTARTDMHQSHFGTWVTALASAVALIFSAVSLYHSVLKQPELQFYVSPVVHYGRDPNGNLEVFAIPVTIANHGARDGTVLSIDLKAQAVGGADNKEFYSAFTVDGSYFVKPARYNRQSSSYERVDRPKQPFAPISVPGRGNYSGTILFYTKAKSVPKVISDKGEYTLTLALNTRLDQSLGFIDSLLQTITKPVTFTSRLKFFELNRLLKGGTHRLYNIDWSTPIAETQSGTHAPSE